MHPYPSTLTQIPQVLYMHPYSSTLPQIPQVLYMHPYANTLYRLELYTEYMKDEGLMGMHRPGQGRPG